jgi:Protein of unknown function (DUF3891)
MIIRPNGEKRIAIMQPDHAALASRIMAAWRAHGLPQSPRRDEILLAIAEHDNGWREVDATLLVDPADGSIRDFMTVSDEIKRGVWTRAIERLSGAPYAAALVAQHAAYVYGRYRGNPAWAQFFVDMEAARDERLRAVARSMDTLMNDYFFVRVGDLISLVFCTRTIMQAPEFGYTVRLDGEHVFVTPDPFGGAEVPISIDGREVDGTAFSRRVTVTGVTQGEP